MKLICFVAMIAILALPAKSQSLPDLTVVSVAGPTVAATAQYVTLSNTLANAGTETAGNWSYRIYLSPDAGITTNDTVLATKGSYVDFAAQTSITVSDVVYIPEGAALGTNYFGVIIDYNNLVTESNEANNAMASAPVTVGIGPDLTVISVAGPAVAGTAQTLTLTNTLANVGMGTAGNWSYRIYLSPDALITTNDIILSTKGSYVDFSAQTTITVADEVFMPETAALGTNYFGVIIDYNNLVTESNETNNAKASAPVTVGLGPDLTVVSVAGPAVAGTAQSVRLTNTLANVGMGTAGNWSYRIYLSPDAVITTNDAVLATLGSFADFAGQSSVTFTDEIFIPEDAALGTHYFGVIINPNQLVTESNEANNARASGPVTFGIGPDLTVVSVAGPNGVGAGQSVTLQSRLANVGPGAAGNWNYCIYLSSDAVITTNDTELTHWGDFGELPAQTTITRSDVVLIPSDASPGTNYFGVIIDCENTVSESDEANNQYAFGPVLIGPVITAITCQSNTVLLSITGLKSSSTCSVEHISALANASGWTTGALFAAGGTSTNLMDVLPPSTTSRLYRVKQH